MVQKTRSKIPCARCGRVHTHNCKPSAMRVPAVERETRRDDDWMHEALVAEHLDVAGISTMVRGLDGVTLSRRYRALCALGDLYNEELYRRRGSAAAPTSVALATRSEVPADDDFEPITKKT